MLVGTEGRRVRVCPVDWEMAAVSPGLVDLAALTSGRWTDDERTAIARAYFDQQQAAGIEVGTFEELQVRKRNPARAN